MYGNIMDTAVLEFRMYVTVKGIFYKSNITGPYLSREMQYILDRKDGKTTIYFKGIKARDRNGSILSVPDFSYTFPFRKEDY